MKFSSVQNNTKLSTTEIFDPGTLKRKTALASPSSEAVRHLLREMQKKTAQTPLSSKMSSTFNQISLNGMDTYKTIVRRVGLLSLILTRNSVSQQEIESIQNCGRELAALQAQLTGAMQLQHFNQTEGKKLTQEMHALENMIIELQHTAEAMAEYRTKAAPLIVLGQQFCVLCDQDPLAGLAQVDTLLRELARFDRSAAALLLENGKADRMRAPKLQDLHRIQMSQFETELKLWIDKLDQAAAQHLKELHYILNRSSNAEAKKQALQQIGVLREYLQSCFPLNASLEATLHMLSVQLVRLQNTLQDLLKKLGKHAKADAAGVKYGSDAWQQLVSSREPLPRGLISRAFSTLKQMPAKWRTRLAQLSLLGLGALYVGARNFTNGKVPPPEPIEPEQPPAPPDILVATNDTISPILPPISRIEILPLPVIEKLVQDLAQPVIRGSGALADGMAADETQIVSHVHAGVEQIIAAHDILRSGAEMAVLHGLVDLEDACMQISERLNLNLTHTPSLKNCSVSQTAVWNQTVVEEAERASIIVDMIRRKIKGKQPVAPPELVKKNENSQLILELLQEAASPPDDKVYANLIGLYRPEIQGTKIKDSKLEGVKLLEPLTFLLETQKAYLKALNKHPSFSSSCREESCATVFGDTAFTQAALTDHSLLQKALGKLELAIQLPRMPPIDRGRAMLQHYETLKPGETFFFPVAWSEKDVAHAMVVELEKDSKEMVIIRLFDLGTSGDLYGSSPSPYGPRQFPYTEIVGIEPKNFFNAAQMSFFDRIEAAPPAVGDEKWQNCPVLQMALASLGGKVNARLDSAHLLRDPQYVGNCGTASLFAAMDKTLVSNPLAERMRALTLFRATKAYYDAHVHSLSSGDERESRRRLLLIGVQATYEAIERAVEVGGILDAGAEELLKRTIQIQAHVGKLQSADLGTLEQAALAFDQYSAWTAPMPQANPAQLLQISGNQHAPHKAQPQPQQQTSSAPLKKPPGFAPQPFKDDAFDALDLFNEKIKKEPLGHNKAALLTPLELDQMWELGFQYAKELSRTANSGSLEVTEKLAHFAQNVENLLNHDQLQTLQKTLMDPAALEKNLQSDQGLVKSIAKLCQNGRKLGHLIESAATESHFAYLSRTAGLALAKAIQKTGVQLDLSEFPDSSQIFDQMIADADPEIEKERLKLIHFHRIKSFEMHIDLTIEEASELLSSVNYLKTEGSPSGVKADEEIKRLDELIQLARTKMDLPQYNSANLILNRMARDMDRHHSGSSWTWEEQYQLYFDSERTMFYDPEKLLLTRQNLGRQLPPDALLQDQLFQFIVGDEQRPLDRARLNVFLYRDQHDVQYRFVLDNRQTPPAVVTQRKFNEQWCQALPPQQVGALPMLHQSAGAHQRWFDGGLFWESVEGQKSAYYTGPINGSGIPLLMKFNGEEAKGFSIFGNTPKARAELLKPSLEKTDAVLLDPGVSPLAALIGRLEDPRFSFSFAKAGRLCKITLPRLGLDFKGEKLLVSHQLDGFGLFAGIQSFPMLGDFPHYLPLKKIDAEGKEETGLLIPNLRFERQESGGLTTPTAFQAVPATWSTRIPYFFYRMKNGVLVPESKNRSETILATLHLANIFLSEHRYAEAGKYLETSDRLLKALGERIEKEVWRALLDIASFAAYNQDFSPDASALRLRAGAMLQRLVNMEQADLIEAPCFSSCDNSVQLDTPFKNDYILYQRHAHRVSAALRLSDQEKDLLAQFLQSPALPKPAAYTFPVPEKEEQLAHPAIQISDPQKMMYPQPSAFRASTQPILGSSAGEIIASADILFVKAFPDALVPLYTLLRNPQDIGLADRKKIAQRFGLDPTIPAAELQISAKSLVELRYRYLVAQLQAAEESPAKQMLELEVNLLGALTRVARGEVHAVHDLEKDTAAFSDLAATLRTGPEYQNIVLPYMYDEIVNSLTGKAQLEALRLWGLWVQPEALPLPLSIERAHQASGAFVGPVHTQPMLTLPPEQQLNAQFTMLDPSLRRPALQFYYAPLLTGWEIDRCFNIDRQKIPLSSSPFELPQNALPEDSPIAKVFKQVDTQYKQYIAAQPAYRPRYALKDAALLKAMAERLKSPLKKLNLEMQQLEKQIEQKLNKLPKNPSQSAHAQLRQARGALRKLTLTDATAALGRGWEMQHLHALNPNLSAEEIQEIFGMTFSLLLKKWDVQRSIRICNAIDQTLSSDPANPRWQNQVGKLKSFSQDKLNYDPYDFPLGLLIETEYEIGLWEDQVSMIKEMAPKERISAVRELAMNRGKTDVISPATLALLADGKTLPIMVVPESLLPSVSGRMQERMGADKGIGTGIRTIPIERGIWSAEKISALRQEMESILKERSALVWSASDVQTLINSFVEDMREISATADQSGLARVKAWGELFHFMRDSAEIIGDEIHALLDILTSYNFSVGPKKPMEADELDGAAFFLKLLLTHPDIAEKVSFSFATIKGGKPFTEELFRDTLKPKLIDSLLQAGCMDEARSQELFAHMTASKKEQVRLYLNSGSEQAQFELFPTLDNTLIDQLANGKQPLDSPPIKELMQKILPSDLEERVKKCGKDRAALVKTVRTLDIEYRALDKRLRNFLAVQKEGLRAIFPSTAEAKLGKHYVLNKEENGAIPADEGTPLWDAQFGFSLERLFYTSFLYFAKKIPKEIIRKDLELFVEKYRKKIIEVRQEVAATGEIDGAILNDPLVKSFEARYGITCPLKERGFNDVELEQLVEWINAKPERQLPLIRDYIFVEQKVYAEEIESSTHMFPLICKPRIGLRGMSGILFNLATFTDQFSAVTLSDTTPMMADRIKMNSPNTVRTISVPETPEQMIDVLYSKSAFGACSIIDTTHIIKKENIEAYARIMLQKIHQKNQNISSLVFFEGDTQKYLKVGRPEALLYDGKTPPEKTAMLIDVSHWTGSNILTGEDAILIVGKHLRLFEENQAAMRLRGLGFGQKLEFVIPEEDRAVVVDRLLRYLKIKVGDNDPLTDDHLKKYALLNEILGEMDNNWRAGEMRMQIAVLEPVLSVIWNRDTPPEQALEMFNVISPLFIKKRQPQPWDQYGQPVVKIKVEDAKEKRLQQWLSHPVLEAISQKPHLFAKVDVQAIKTRLNEIASADMGPLADKVDTEFNTGHKQRTKEKEQAKVKVKTKDRERIKQQIRERVELFVKQRHKAQNGVRVLQPLRRLPYQPHQAVPFAEKPFSRAAYSPIPLKEATSLSLPQLQPAQLAKRAQGPAISAADVLSLDTALSNVLQIKDPDLLISLNLAPVWNDQQQVAPLYTPYGPFHKFPTHALLIHDKASNTLKLQLLDSHDAQAAAEKLRKDRQAPDEQSEVNLTLYHLHENRLVASGKTPANPAKIPQLNTRSSELLAQAKLLSGITHYTPEEAEQLEAWMKERQPKEILQKFVLQIALHKDETLEKLPKSKLGKIFQNCGITEEEIKELVNSPTVTSVKEVHALLFDRALASSEWQRKALALSKLLDKDLTRRAALWSDALTPLLPVKFDVSGRDGVTQREKLISSDDVSRRWLMDTFFHSVADEYGAWRTALPQLVGKLEKEQPPLFAKLFNALFSTNKEEYGTDADVAFLQEAFDAKQLNSKTSIISVEQLETASELAHPLWGLPLLVRSQKAGEFFELSTIRSIHPVAEPELGDLWKQVLAHSGTHDKEALALANQAIGLIDLVGTLRAIENAHPQYEYQRLYGVFAFLAKQNLNPEARREYALKILPDLFGERLSEDMSFFAQYIPKSLTVGAEHYTQPEIYKLLNQCYHEALNKAYRSEKLTESLPSSKEISYALRAFAKEAPKNVLVHSRDWLHQLLQTQPEASWWIDQFLFQLLERKEPIIEHQLYASYFANEPGPHMVRAADHGVTGALSLYEASILSNWGLADFDLFASLADLHTANKPFFTPYQMAVKWTAVLQQADLRSHDAGRTLWHRILGPIADAVRAAPPTHQQDKQALRGLLQVLDQYSFSLETSDFENIQRELGPIRLAADYAFDLPRRRDFAMEEIKKFLERDDQYRELYSFFIPNFLLTESEAKTVTTEAIEKLMNDLYAQSKASDKFPIRVWNDLLNQLMPAFTVKGTTAQQQKFIQWTGNLLEKGEAATLMTDATVYTVLNHFADAIEHDDLRSYLENKPLPAGQAQHFFIMKIDEFAPNSIVQSDLQKYAYVKDFDLFAELVQLKTKNRQPLAHSDYASKLNTMIHDHVQKYNKFLIPRDLLNPILEVIHERAHAVPFKDRDIEALSELIETIDEAYKNETIDSPIEGTNQLRLISDYPGIHPAVELQQAVSERFTSGESPFRIESYNQLIPQLIKRTQDNAWVVPTAAAIMDATASLKQLTDDERVLLNTLFLDYPERNKLLPALLNQRLPNSDKENVVLTHLLKMNWEKLEEVEHAHLIAYLERTKQAAPFIHHLQQQSSEITRFEMEHAAGGNLDLYMRFMEIKTKHQPPLSVQELVKALKGYQSMTDKGYQSMTDKERVGRTLDRLLQKLIALKPSSQADKQAVSELVRVLDQHLWAPHGRLNQLRRMADYTGSPNDNMSKAVADWLNAPQRAPLRKFIINELANELQHNQGSMKLMTDLYNKMEKQFVAKNIRDDIFEIIRAIGNREPSLKILLQTVNGMLSPLSAAYFQKETALVLIPLVFEKLPKTFLGNWGKISAEEKAALTTFYTKFRQVGVEMTRLEEIHRQFL